MHQRLLLLLAVVDDGAALERVAWFERCKRQSRAKANDSC